MLRKVHRISCANGDESADILVNLKGDLQLSGENNVRVDMNSILYSEKLNENLVSLRKLVEQDLKIILDKNSIRVIDPRGNKTVMLGNYENNFWWLKFKVLKGVDVKGKAYQVGEKDSGEGNGGSLQGGECPRERYEHDSQCMKRKSDSQESYETSLSKKMKNLDVKVNGGRLGMGVTYDPVPRCLMGIERDTLSKTGRSLRDSPGLLWHKRLNHISKGELEIAAKRIPCLKNVKFGSEIMDCFSCPQAKLNCLPYKSKRFRYTSPMVLIHSDTMGQISPPTYLHKLKYAVTFIDDYSRFAMVYTTDNKTEVHEGLRLYMDELRTVLGPKTRCFKLRTDNGTEYRTAEMKQLMLNERIEFDRVAPYSPQHNGTAERFNRELQEKARAILIDSGLPARFWDVALAFVVHVYNRMPKKSLNYETPYERIYGRKPTLEYIRRFGCLVYVKKMITSGKFDVRAERMFLVGCTETGYRCLEPKSGRIVDSKHIKPIETYVYADFFGKSTGTKREIPTLELQGEEALVWSIEEGGRSEDVENQNTEGDRLIEVDSVPQNPNQISNVDILTKASSVSQNVSQIIEDDEIVEVECEIEEIEGAEPDEETRKSIKEMNEQLKKEEDDDYLYDVQCEEIEDDSAYFALAAKSYCLLIQKHNRSQEPTTYKQALASNEAQYWKKAIQSELDSLEKNRTWKLINQCEVPKGKPIIDSRWLFKRKIEPDNSVRYKGRLVTRGFKDTNIYDKTETYAPVARICDVRLLLSISNKFGLKLYQMDVKTAFLNGTLEQPVYMRIPEGYPCKTADREVKVCKLIKALYGLKVSPKRWYVEFTAFLDKMGFKVYPFQSCIFWWRRDEKYAIVLLYVDDILMTGNCEDKLHETKRQLKDKFQITDLGAPKRFLGIDIERDETRRMLFIHQSRFVDEILERFGMTDCNAVNTPMVTRQAEQNLLKNSERAKRDEAKIAKELRAFDQIPYREAIGSLLYLANGTRPDILYAVNYCSRKQSNFEVSDWMKIKRIFRYLRGTRNYGLMYRGLGNGIDAYPDASWGSNDDRSSTSGYVIKVFGDVVNWRVKKQAHVSLSSAQAEYSAMSLVCRELAAIREMNLRLLKINITPTVFEDNRSAITMSKTDDCPGIRHLVDLHEHYVRQEVKRRNVFIVWIDSKNQLGDFFTKPLARDQFENFRCKLMYQKK